MSATTAASASSAASSADSLDALASEKSRALMQPLTTCQDAKQAEQLFHSVVDSLLSHTPPSPSPLTAASIAPLDESAAAALTLTHTHAAAMREWIRQCMAEGIVGGSDESNGTVTDTASSSSSSSPSAALTSTLTSLGVPSAISSTLTSAFLFRRAELFAFARRCSIQNLANWGLVDFDWEARLTLASSALSHMRSPSVSVAFGVASPRHHSDSATCNARKVQVEMDAAALDRVLEQMEQINRIVQEYTTNNNDEGVEV